MEGENWREKIGGEFKENIRGYWRWGDRSGEVLFFEEGEVFLNGFLDEGKGFVHSTPDLAAGCVLVASTAEELGGHFVAGEVVNGTEGYADAGVLCVLAEEDREFHSQDLQGKVDEAFGVTVEDAKTATLGVGKGHDGGVRLLPDIELHVEHVAHEFHAVGAVGEEDIAVDFVLVDAELKEDADELKDFGAGAGVGEGAGVGHHAGVKGGGFVVGEEGDSGGKTARHQRREGTG